MKKSKLIALSLGVVVLLSLLFINTTAAIIGCVVGAVQGFFL